MAQDEEINWIRNLGIKESEILVNLTNDSPEFKLFYKRERNNIKKSIIWVQNSSLPIDEQLAEGHIARTYFLSNGEVVVIVRNNPCGINDSSTIAHELAHILLDEEGYPQVGHNPKFAGKKQIETLAFYLNNMIQDPLVIEKLQSYGYDLRGEYVKECKEFGEKLKSFKAPKDDLEQMFFAFLYVQCVLENRLLFGEEKTECSKNIDIIFSKLNYLALKGRKMLKIVDKYGMKDPDSVKTIYEEIINAFDLNDYIKIYYQHS